MLNSHNGRNERTLQRVDITAVSSSPIINSNRANLTKIRTQNSVRINSKTRSVLMNVVTIWYDLLNNLFIPLAIDQQNKVLSLGRLKHYPLAVWIREELLGKSFGRTKLLRVKCLQ